MTAKIQCPFLTPHIIRNFSVYVGFMPEKIEIKPKEGLH